MSIYANVTPLELNELIRNRKRMLLEPSATYLLPGAVRDRCMVLYPCDENILLLCELYYASITPGAYYPVTLNRNGARTYVGAGEGQLRVPDYIFDLYVFSNDIYSDTVEMLKKLLSPIK